MPQLNNVLHIPILENLTKSEIDQLDVWGFDVYISTTAGVYSFCAGVCLSLLSSFFIQYYESQHFLKMHIQRMQSEEEGQKSDDLTEQEPQVQAALYTQAPSFVEDWTSCLTREHRAGEHRAGEHRAGEHRAGELALDRRLWERAQW